MSQLDAFREVVSTNYPSLVRSLDETIASGGTELRTLAETILGTYGRLVDGDVGRLAADEQINQLGPRALGASPGQRHQRNLPVWAAFAGACCFCRASDDVLKKLIA